MTAFGGERNVAGWPKWGRMPNVGLLRFLANTGPTANGPLKDTAMHLPKALAGNAIIVGVQTVWVARSAAFIEVLSFTPVIEVGTVHVALAEGSR